MPMIASWGAQVFATALAVLAFHVAGWGVFDNILVSAIAVWTGFMAGFLFRMADETAPRWERLAAMPAMALLFSWCLWKWTGLMMEQEEFFIALSPLDDAWGWLGLAIAGWMTWRLFGLPMVLVVLAAAVYVLAPMSWGGGGEDWTRVAENLWYSTDGAFGRPVEVVSRVVLVFILFGAILQASGAGAVLLKMAFAATGRLPGGPAHASIVSSAMFGTLSGAAVANVVSTGVFTIPIIRKVGFRPAFAGAVEAAASTGGQILPPVMGVVAFLMSDVTGIPYLEIVAAALIPALMYYASLAAVVVIEARREGIGATPPADRERLTRRDWLQSLAFWVPLRVLIWWLVDGRSPANAGFAATIAAAVLCLILFPEFRDPRRWRQALTDAGRTSAQLMIIVTAIGFVIGVVNMIGIGIRFGLPPVLLPRG